ncbi:MAG: hypothetical protein ACLTY5_07115 [Angelakisella sp.]
MPSWPSEGIPMMSAAATKTKPRVMSRGGIIACMVLTLLTPVGLLLIHLARGNAEEVEHLYSRGFYQWYGYCADSADREGALFGNGGHPAFAGAAALVFLVLWIRKPSGRKDAGGWYA